MKQRQLKKTRRQLHEDMNEMAGLLAATPDEWVSARAAIVKRLKDAQDMVRAIDALLEEAR